MATQNFYPHMIVGNVTKIPTSTVQDFLITYQIANSPLITDLIDAYSNNKPLVDFSHPFIEIDNNKCILCSRCIRVCDELVGANALGLVNLEGDVAAFLVASDQTNFDATPSINLEDSGFIADSLKSYLVSNPTEWNNRAKNFLKVLGAKLIGTSCQISNLTDLKKSVASKIQNFGELYMVNRLRQNGNISIDTLIAASSHLVGASKEITEIFIDTLSRNCAAPDKPLSASGIDPNPTPKAEPFAKYVAMKKAQEAEKKAEDWINEIEKWFDKW